MIPKKNLVVCALAIVLLALSRSQAQQTSPVNPCAEAAIAAIEKAATYRVRGSAKLMVSPTFNEQTLSELIKEGQIKPQELGDFKAGVTAGYLGISEPRAFQLTLDGAKIKIDGEHRDQMGNPVPYTYAFNGERAKYLIPQDNQAFIQGDAAARYALLLREPVRLGKLLYPEHTEKQRSELQQVIREGTCVEHDNVIDVDYDDPWQPYLRRIRIDMNKGGLVVLSQSRFLTGELFSESRIEDARQTNYGEWVVLKYSETDYTGKKGREKPYFTMIHELQGFTERTDIPDTEFDVVFPPDCTVHDEIMGITTSAQGGWVTTTSQPTTDAKGAKDRTVAKMVSRPEEHPSPRQSEKAHPAAMQPDRKTVTASGGKLRAILAVLVVVTVVTVAIVCYRYSTRKGSLTRN